MPYKSQAQERWAHTPAGLKALGGAGKVKEWDSASKGLKLPARKAPSPGGLLGGLRRPSGKRGK